MTNGRMDGRMDRCMERWIDGWMTKGRTDGWMNGKMDGWVATSWLQTKCINECWVHGWQGAKWTLGQQTERKMLDR